LRLAPLSDALVKEVFGDPTPFMRPDGTVDHAWEAEILEYVVLPAPLPLSWNRAQHASRLKVHRLIAPHLRAALLEIYASPGAWASINDIGGCYEFRRISGTKSLSRHSWGIAIDWDVRDNPMFGLIPRVHPEVKRIMLQHGFCWGGATIWGGSFPWRRRDAMHHEFCEITTLR